MAGQVHFSVFFRYMEEAEHALWRSVGMSVAPKVREVTWPRVAAACDFKQTLHYEDQFEVQTQITKLSGRSIRYEHTIVRGDTVIGSGMVTAACVMKQADGSIKAVDIPAEIIERLKPFA